MRWHDVGGEGAAIDVLLDRAIARGRRPDGLLDRILLAYPEAFGAELAQPLAEARELVLRDGDARSRESLRVPVSAAVRHDEITRIGRILARRPTPAERSASALVRVSERMYIALAHPIPCDVPGIAVRIQLDLHPEIASASANRCEPSAKLLAAWAALGHTTPPHAVWACEPPSWCVGGPDLSLAIELVPNPSELGGALLVAFQGAARVLALGPPIDTSASGHEWRTATVMPSGWSYLYGDRTMGSSLPTMPNGAPFPATHVRVPDDDLFAVCAARSWTGSLRDSVWLRKRNDFRLLAGEHTTTQGDTR